MKKLHEFGKKRRKDPMLPKEDAIKAILDVGVIAIVRLDSCSQLMSVTQALTAGGIRAIEFTMTTPGALDVLKEATNRIHDDTILGAGTVLDGETARAAILAGAKFIVAPNLKLDVVSMTHRYSVAVIPGAFTPSEIVTAWEAGADMVKVFPASIGGPDLIAALRGPFPQIKLVPTGGVDFKSIKAYIKAGSVAVAIGGNLVGKDIVQRGEFEKITQLAEEYVKLVKQARSLI